MIRQKNKLRALLAACLMLAVGVCCLLPAAAAAPVVTFHGLEEGFGFAPGSAYTATDLFGAFHGMMPGDRRTETVEFRNEAEDCDYVNLYLRAEPHDAEGNPLSAALVAAGETVERADDFLAQLTLSIRTGDRVVYEGPANAGLESPVALGTFRSGESAAIAVELSMPAELGNEYAGRMGEIDWVFHAEGFTESQLTVRKVWSDGNDAHAADSVTVNLLCDGEIRETQTLSAENQWTYTFDRLSEGHTWSAEEAAVPEGYDVSYTTEGNVTTITNTRRGTAPDGPVRTELSVRKVWDGGKHPDTVTVTLYDGSTAADTVTLSDANGWSHAWTGLHESAGWQVRETNVPKGYTPSYVSRDGVVTITNTATLIQTGQLNWPIYVLIGLGLVLVVLGCALILRRRRHA